MALVVIIVGAIGLVIVLAKKQEPSCLIKNSNYIDEESIKENEEDKRPVFDSTELVFEPEKNFPPEIQKLVDKCKAEGISFMTGSERHGWLFVRNVTSQEADQVNKGYMSDIPIEIEIRSRFKPIYGNPLYLSFPLNKDGNMVPKIGEYEDKKSLFIFWKCK